MDPSDLTAEEEERVAIMVEGGASESYARFYLMVARLTSARIRVRIKRCEQWKPLSAEEVQGCTIGEALDALDGLPAVMEIEANESQHYLCGTDELYQHFGARTDATAHTFAEVMADIRRDMPGVLDVAIPVNVADAFPMVRFS